MKRFLLVGFYIIHSAVFAEHKTTTVYVIDSKENSIYIEAQFNENKMPCPIFHVFRKKQRLNKRITAAVLSFPFPFF